MVEEVNHIKEQLEEIPKVEERLKAIHQELKI